MEFSSTFREREDEWEVLEDVWVAHISARALKVVYEGDEFWIPKSQLDDWRKYRVDRYAETMLVKAWFARKAEMI